MHEGEIHLQVARHVGPVGDVLAGHRIDRVCAQSRSEQQVAAQPRGAQLVRGSRRRRVGLVVVEIDVVAGDIGELAGLEIELAGDDAPPLRLLHRPVGVDAERSPRIAGRELHASRVALGVVERCQDDRGAELAFVDQVPVLPVEAVHAHGDAGDLLLAPHVVIGLAVREGRGVEVGGRRRGGSRELADRLHGHQLERRRGEIAGVAGVQGRAGQGSPHRIDPRAPLVLVAVGVQLVEAQAVVQRQRRQQLPLVLQIGAVSPGGLGAVVVDADGNIAELEHAPARVPTQRHHLGGRAADGAVALHDHPAAQGVGRAGIVGALDLQPAGCVVLVGVL